jgi:hypothetical protein
LLLFILKGWPHCTVSYIFTCTQHKNTGIFTKKILLIKKNFIFIFTYWYRYVYHWYSRMCWTTYYYTQYTISGTCTSNRWRMYNKYSYYLALETSPHSPVRYLWYSSTRYSRQLDCTRLQRQSLLLLGAKKSVDKLTTGRQPK